MNTRCYADLRVDVRVYFDDDGEFDLKDQAIEALDAQMSLPDDEGECEVGGIEVLRVERHD